MLHVTKSFRALVALLIIALFAAPTSFSGELEYGPVASLTADPAITCIDPNRGVNEYANLIIETRNNQPDLAEALRLFPKGADIHNHLSGTILPEKYIEMGIADGACYGPDKKDSSRYSIANGTSDGVCDKDFIPLASVDQSVRNKIVESLSMYKFDYNNIQQGHDQFFATFGRFNAVAGSNNTAVMLAKLLQRSNADSVSYVETMLSFQPQALATLTKLLRREFPEDETYRDSANYQAMYTFLLGVGLKDAVTGAQYEIAQSVNKTNALLRCGSADRDQACDVTYAFLAAVNRNSGQLGSTTTPDLAKIFTQTAFSVLLDASEDRVVGINLLSGEDSAISMKSFDTQMKFFAYFHNAFPKVNIALHAGELTPCFIGSGNSALKDHLTGSLKAGAKRIGHGVSFAYLKDKERAEVAGLIKQNNALVEIMFTSNAQILGVAGDTHPFMQYAKYEVPMAFSTDDEGVSYANYTDEWIYGLMKYKLDWNALQNLGRNSLQYSFIPGGALWSDMRSGKLAEQCTGQTPGSPNPSDQCKSFLDSNAKAKAQWAYEARLTNYWQTNRETYGKYFGGVPGVHYSVE